MNNEEVMNLMTDMGLHEGGMENWIPDNAWVRVVNKVIEIEREESDRRMVRQRNNYGKTMSKVVADEREACAKVCDEREKPNLYGVRECAAAIRARGEK
jgi:hypothetical protein